MSDAPELRPGELPPGPMLRLPYHLDQLLCELHGYPDGIRAMEDVPEQLLEYAPHGLHKAVSDSYGEAKYEREEYVISVAFAAGLAVGAGEEIDEAAAARIVEDAKAAWDEDQRLRRARREAA